MGLKRIIVSATDGMMDAVQMQLLCDKVCNWDSLFVLPQDEVYYTLLTFAPIDKLRPWSTKRKR